MNFNHHEYLSRAQTGATLDSLMLELLSAVAGGQMAETHIRTGFAIKTDPESGDVAIRAHGKVLCSEREHVWETDGNTARLVGRIQFRLSKPNGDLAPVVCTFFIDEGGNLRESTASEATHCIADTVSDAAAEVRRVLLFVIHQHLDVVKAPTAA